MTAKFARATASRCDSMCRRSVRCAIDSGLCACGRTRLPRASTLTVMSATAGSTATASASAATLLPSGFATTAKYGIKSSARRCDSRVARAPIRTALTCARVQASLVKLGLGTLVQATPTLRESRQAAAAKRGDAPTGAGAEDIESSAFEFGESL